MNHIAKLDPLVARRIAAGEVIDRPASVVRELVDNAIDAHPSHITLTLENGGIDLISVLDDGSGIAREDLPLCCESHATSKIHTLEDLYHIDTMGFRGEALYSISAVSKTTIQSVTQSGEPASIVVDNGIASSVVPGGPSKGTLVTSEALFLDIPARRQFLKRPATEMQRCREVFLEKAIAYPEITFTFISDGQKRFELQSTGKKNRVLDVLALDKKIVPAEMKEISLEGGKYSLYAVCSSFALYRSDKSGIRIFVNNRPVDEYSMVQAVTYGYGEMLPGGAFPYCYLFISDDPTLVDFNIHPTKREVKIRNRAEIHHGVTSMLHEKLNRTIPRMTLSRQDSLPFREASYPEKKGEASAVATHHPSYHASSSQAEEKPIDPMWFSKAREILGHEKQKMEMRVDRSTDTDGIWNLPHTKESDDFIYLGQAFNLFLICQRGDKLFLVDQHAAHERILYNAIKQKKDVQQLLIPIPFDVERDVDSYLAQSLDIYLNLGIKLERIGDCQWNLTTIPSLLKNIESDIIAFIQNQTGDASEVEKGLYAVVACHKAIKQGDTVDRTTAIHLLKQVFSLEDPVCPHGRTFVVRLDKQELMAAVGRIV